MPRSWRIDASFEWDPRATETGVDKLAMTELAMQTICQRWDESLAAMSPKSAVRIASVDALLLRSPLLTPIKNSFRTLTERFALLIRVRDPEGLEGWGEVWCNYPPHGAAARAQLLEDVVAPIAIAQPAQTPAMHFQEIGRRLRVPALVSGDHGSFEQVRAGLDQALWDLAARRLNVPLWQMLRHCAGLEITEQGPPRTRVYASGLGGETAPELAIANAQAGHNAFKLKVGFGAAEDAEICASLRAAIGDEAALMLDANQRWTPAEAVLASRKLMTCNPLWLEEPMPADIGWSEWQTLAREGAIPLAAGENLRSWKSFQEGIAAGCLYAIQPDAGKWGGFTGLLAIARAAFLQTMEKNAPLFCPHWLGGGVGLLAAQHLAAAVPYDFAWLEVDANVNPLRTEFMPKDWTIQNGTAQLPTGAGLGFEPSAAALRSFAAQ
jgi:L-alanine-DL-glutamate epimerase-like enolase superfamily enzyme